MQSHFLAPMAVSPTDPLLVAEDSDEDFEALQRLMRGLSVPNPIYRCADGEEVLDVLRDRTTLVPPLDPKAIQPNPLPSVILLDLNLPGLDGREVLVQLKQDERFREIPIVVFTTSASPSDIEFCYQQGANAYLIKPMGTQALQRTIQAFINFWLNSNTPPTLTSPALSEG